MTLEGVPRDEAGRPIVDTCLTELVRALVETEPAALGHVDARFIVFVAGAARLESRASIRPLMFPGSPTRDVSGTWQKPSVTIEGERLRYEICLRPKFFLESSAEERLNIIAHELWHASPRFDGTLAEHRRHMNTEARVVEHEAKALTRHVRGLAHTKFLEIKGELRMRAWTSRPPSRLPIASKLRRIYTERDLHLTILRQR